jgi:hypothetical protein
MSKLPFMLRSEHEAILKRELECLRRSYEAKLRSQQAALDIRLGHVRKAVQHAHDILAKEPVN